MCFTTKTSHELSVQTSRNIYAFKVLTFKNKVLWSPIKSKIRWKMGLKKTVANFQTQAYYNEVNIGIHCFKTIQDAINGFYLTNLEYSNENHYVLVNVVIPEGTLCYENDTQYCAKTVILHSKTIPISKLI